MPLLTPLMRKSLADVSRRKLRTALVVLGITVGVGGLTAINTGSGALYAAFAYTASKTAISQISVSVRECDPSIASDLRSLPNVNVVQLQTFFPTRWKISASPGYVNMGITAHADLRDVKLFPFQLSAGRPPGVGEIVMESGDRALQPVRLGDNVTLTTPRGPVDLHVVGLSRTLGRTSAGFSSFATGYMSTDGLASATGIDRPNDLQISVHDPNQAGATARAVASWLRDHGIVVLNTSLGEGYFDASPVNGLFVVMNVLSVVALLLTGFLIINSITTLVGEQVAVIGSMKAIGATRRRVMRGYLTTVLVYGAAGTALGIPLGLFGGYQLTRFLADIVTLDIGPFAVDPRVIALAVLVGLGAPVSAALLPLWSGTRITVREAISAYGMSGGGPRRVAGASGPLRWVPQTVWLGLRSVFRRRVRAALTLLALTFAAAAFLAIQTTTYSFDVFLGKLFTQYNSDMFVFMTRPAPYEQVRHRLLAVPNVARVERFENAGVKTRWGTILLTGTEDDPVLYRRDVIAGRWYRPDEKRVLLINEQLSQRSGLKVGDPITISNATKTETWTVIGEVHDLNGGLGLAGVSLTPIGQLYDFLDRPEGYAGGFMLGTTNRSQSAVDRTASSVDNDLTGAGLAPFVTTAQQNVKRNQNQFQILYVLLSAVAAIVALVGILGLFNTLTTSVLERRREIGILRSVGATGRRVAAVFWTEGMALAAIAWVVAVVLGIPAAYGFLALISAVLIGVPFAFDPISLVAMLAFTLVIASLASVVPAWAAARLRVVATLRYE